MEQPKKKAKEIIEQIEKVTGSDKTSELLHATKAHHRENKVFQDRISVSLEHLASKDLVTREDLTSIVAIVKTLKTEFPAYFDVKVLNQKLPTEIKITNPEDLKQASVKFEEADWLKASLENLRDVLAKVFTKQLQDINITGPTSAKKAIAVRLSDGNNFYTALNQIVQTASGTAADMSEVVDKLDQIIAALGGAVNIINKFGEASVVPATETILCTHTIPVTKSYQNRGLFAEGNGNGIFRLYKNSLKIWQNRNEWTMRGFDSKFEFDADAGDIIELKVIHNLAINHDFSGGFYGSQF